MGGPDERFASDHRFQATPVPATAQFAALGDDHVAQLPGPEPIADEKPAVEDDARPDAPADMDDDQVRFVSVVAEREFSQGGGLAVVGDMNRHMISAGQPIPQLEFAPIQVSGVPDNPSF